MGSFTVEFAKVWVCWGGEPPPAQTWISKGGWGREIRRRGGLGCLRSSGSSCLKCVGEGSWLDTWLGELERATLGVGAAVPLRMQAEAGRWHFHCGCLQAPPTLGENLDAGGGDRLGKEGCGS